MAENRLPGPLLATETSHKDAQACLKCATGRYVTRSYVPCRITLSTQSC